MHAVAMFRRTVVACAFALAAAGSALASDDLQQEALSSRELRLADSLAGGGMPRDMALHAQLSRVHAGFPGAPDTPSTELREAAAAAPRDRLVQWMWAAASLADAGCTTASPCAGREMALARLEPDNGIAWLPALDAASRRGDRDGTTVILGRMAGATRNDDLFIDASEAWYAAEAQVPLSAQELSQVRASLPGHSGEQYAIIAAIARAAAFALPSVAVVGNACNPARDPAAASRHVACAAIGRSMLSTGSSTLVRLMGRSILRLSGDATPADVAQMRLVDWNRESGARFMAAEERDPAGLQRYFRDLVATGSEYEAVARVIGRHGGSLEPPADWLSASERGEQRR